MNFYRKIGYKKKLTIILLVLAVVGMSIGFAAFSTTLNISSSASVNPNSDDFKVRFSKSETTLVEGSVSPSYISSGIASSSNAIINNSSFPTLTNISATFTQPGQYVEYSVYVRNVGEYTAYLNLINFTGGKTCETESGESSTLAEAACSSIEVYVEIDGKKYYDSNTISNHPLSKNSSELVKVGITYISGGAYSDTAFSVKLRDITLVYSTIDNPGYVPPVISPTDKVETLNSKIKARSLGTDENIDFSKGQGDFQGNGVFVRKGTEEKINPIYYFRGAITSNYVLFANKCWLIVRTTESGGVKMIYNGTPTSDNKCTSSATSIGKAIYNNITNYSNVIEDVSYIYPDGSNSVIKQTVDTWYTANMTAYTDMLEDTVWCNDKSETFKGYHPSWNMNATLFGPHTRNVEAKQPTLDCPVDSALTVSATQASNRLTYPIGLLTADELTLAGMGTTGYIYEVYLNNLETWWTMSPSDFVTNYGGTARIMQGGQNGNLNYAATANSMTTVRPAISLKAGALVSSGNGTWDSPYVIE